MLRSNRVVLSNLRKLTGDNSDEELSFLGCTNCICVVSSPDYSLTYDYSKYKKEIHSIIRQLVKDEYLMYTRNDEFFIVTQKGLHPYRFHWETLKLFLFRSVAVPIAVSVATTLLTLYLTELLGWM